MEIEEKQVLLNRWNIFRTLFQEWRDKEWWYTGVYDPGSGVYFSWYFVRVNLADQFVMTIFDPELDKPIHISKKMFTDSARPADRLSLNRSGRSFSVAYNGRGDGPDAGWTFQTKNKMMQADINIKPTIPYFTKFDYKIKDRYGLMHYFHNRADGHVTAGGKRYEIKNALVYYDHCFGRVPERTGWHWIAVQNEKAAIASLINYGAYGQLYTEIYFKDAGPRPGQWIRLNQDVSFEFRQKDKWNQTWRVTSPDMDLEVQMIRRKTDRTLIPFFVDLTHTEVYVKVAGKTRVDGTWVETGDMFGVLEEHKGWW